MTMTSTIYAAKKISLNKQTKTSIIKDID